MDDEKAVTKKKPGAILLSAFYFSFWAFIFFPCILKANQEEVQ
jgi:hypothetical protein